MNHIFWFNSVNHKATEKMEKQFASIKSAESESDFNNAPGFVQEMADKWENYIFIEYYVINLFPVNFLKCKVTQPTIVQAHIS